MNYGFEFFSLFVPAGTPMGLLPLLVLIEFVSYLARCVSLGLRLSANLVAAHLLLFILSGFTYNIMAPPPAGEAPPPRGGEGWWDFIFLYRIIAFIFSHCFLWVRDCY